MRSIILFSLLLGTLPVSATKQEEENSNLSGKHYKHRYNLFHKIAFSHQATDFAATYQTLVGQKQENNLSENEFKTQIKDLLIYADIRKNDTPIYADYFARIQKDQLPDEEKKAFICLESGSPQEALRTYQDLNYLHHFSRTTQTGADADSTQHEFFRKALERQAYLGFCVGGKQNYEAASALLHTIALSDTLAPKNIFPYLSTLIRRKSYPEAERWANRILNAPCTPVEKAQALTLAGKIAYDTQAPEKGDSCFQLAVKLYEDLSKTELSTEAYRSYLEDLFAIGSVLQRHEKHQQAIQYAQQIISLNEIRANNGADLLIKPCLRAYILAGASLIKAHKYELCNKTIDEGIKFTSKFEEHLEEEADYYLSFFHYIQASANAWMGDRSKAEEKMEKAMEIAINLSKQTDSYYGFLAMTTTGKADLYSKDKKFCAKLYEAAINQRLKEGAYTPDEIKKINQWRYKTGEYYIGQKQLKKATTYFEEANQVYQLYQLAFPQQINFDYACFLNKYGNHLFNTGNISRSIQISRQALDTLLATEINEDMNAWIVSSAILLSRALTQNNERREAKKILKEYEGYLERIKDQKLKQTWSNSYIGAYQRVNR